MNKICVTGRFSMTTGRWGIKLNTAGFIVFIQSELLRG
ncbi:hypothetical protein LACWKB8_0767 [Lactobacillus sp. wkB8]|nr:hypothetical protein LACWKB8_0767 [Lactobacillus sp. wkB8]